MEFIIEKVRKMPFPQEDRVIFPTCLIKRVVPEEDEEVSWDKFAEKNKEIDIFVEEDPSCIHAAALIPGVSRERLEVCIDNRDLFIEAKSGKNGEEENSGEPLFWKKFADLSFSGHTTLPADVDAEKSDAQYKDGVLYLKLPKPETAKPRTIPVK